MADHIQRYWRVIAQDGPRIRYSGGDRPKLGTVVGTQDSRLLIRLDGQEDIFPYHPTWKIEYLSDQAATHG